MTATFRRHTSNRSQTLFLLFAGLFSVGTLPLSAIAVDINFNDGTNGAFVGNFYAGLGVTFSANTQWDNFVSPDEGLVGAGGLKISDVTAANYQPKITNPLVATFSTPISSFQIRGLNVGSNGARIDAYDAAVGGALIDFDEAFGVSAGTSNHPLLVTSGTPIWRVHMYQPQSVEIEGLLFDNMSFLPVPEPTTLLLLATALALTLGSARKRRG